MAATADERNKAFVLDAFDTLANRRDFVAAQRFWSPDYIQHRAHIPPGRDSLFDLVKASPPDRRYENALAVADGDYVMLYGRLTTSGPARNRITADIVRWKTGSSPNIGMWCKTRPPPRNHRAGCPCSATPSRQGPDSSRRQPQATDCREVNAMIGTKDRTGPLLDRSV